MSEQRPLAVSAPAWLAWLDARAFPRAVSWLTASHLRALVALVLFSLLCFLPGQASIPAVDRDEARYVQATTQMLETGDYVDIRLHEQPRHIQPAGIYWLQAATVRVLGADVPAPIWVHRLPSLIGACAIVLLAYWCGLVFGDRRIALLAGVMMASVVLLNVEARLAKTDAVLNAAILACQAVLLRLYVSDEAPAKGSWLAVVFWLAAGVGLMVKGPILPMVVGLTVVTASALARDVGWLRALRPAIGIPLMLAVALPWYVAIWFETDGSFFATALSTNVVGKVTTGQESHGFPPGFFVAAVWLTLWPVAVVTATAVPALWQARRRRAMLFLAAWVLPTWIAFELISTKLPHYVLPLYPALVLAAAWALAGGRIDGDKVWTRILIGVSALGPVVLVAGALAIAGRLGGGASPGAVALAVVAAGFAAAALVLIARRALLAGWLVLAVGAAPAAYACMFGAVAPGLDALWLSPRLAAASVEVTGCADPNVISVGNAEASLIFAVGTDIRLGGVEDAAVFLGAGPCRAAIVDDRVAEAFPAALSQTGVEPERKAHVSGFNIGNARFVDYTIYGSPTSGG